MGHCYINKANYQIMMVKVIVDKEVMMTFVVLNQQFNPYPAKAAGTPNP